MKPTVPQTEDLRKPLTDAYAKLSPLRKNIIQLFSVIYEPVSRTVLLECLRYSKIRDENKKPFTSSSISPILETLIGANLLVQEKGFGPQCNPLIVEIATRDAVKEKTFETWVEIIEEQIPIRQRWKDGPRAFNSDRQVLREVRIGLYRKDLKFINQQFEDYYRYGYQAQTVTMDDVMARVCNNPFDKDWFRTLPMEIYSTGLMSILSKSTQKLQPADAPFALMQEDCITQGTAWPDKMRMLFLDQLLWRGRLQEVKEQLDRLPETAPNQYQVFWGWAAFWEGNYTQAIVHYAAALKRLRDMQQKRKIYFDTVSGVFYVLALIKEGSVKSLREAKEHTSAIAKQPNHWLKTVHALLNVLLQIQQGDLSQKAFVANVFSTASKDRHSIEILINALCLYWVNVEQARKILPNLLTPFYERAGVSGHHWLAMEMAELLSRVKPKSTYEIQANILREGSGICSIVDLIQPQEAWELCLNALTTLNKEPQSTTTSAKAATSLRLAWFITFLPRGCLIQPREQKANAKGVWNAGRNVALKRLRDPEEIEYLTSQDLRVCEYIYAQSSYGYGRRSNQYEFGERAITALIGHPVVFWENSPTVRIEVVKGEPELLVKKGDRGWLTLEFSPQITEDKNILCFKETPTRLKVIEITAEHRHIANILGPKNRLEVPAAAKERVLAAINAVSGVVTVHSDIGGELQNAEEVPSKTEPHIHLLPAGEGLKVAVMVRPFDGGGPYFYPGMGGETVVAEIDGKRLQTTRKLKEEKELAKTAIAACPTLARQSEENGEWWVEEPEDCLELLLEFQALGDTVTLEWPEGEKLRVTRSVGLNDFQMKIQRQQDWFAASGELRLDDNLVLDMQRLMELLDQTSSRFIPLGDGQFLALTQTFRKRLDELRAFSEKQGKGRKFHPLATFALEEFVDEVGQLQVDKHWKDHLKKLKEMETLDPKLPSTLQAELRDYQLEGFKWLARLAHWGVGACLADDMGLGKTLQALAIILNRAVEGPTLIVAPTSVCMNWISEAQKFAPTLNVIQFGSGESPMGRQGQRQKTLDQLQPLDMLICSYGLLQQEEMAQMLAQVQWQTIVLDEAQAIKNFATKRSQGAMQLQAGFRILTTGTPIENHLGELWNLFRFINPGLLSSLEDFNERFAVPIERHQDHQARNKLKKLIQPFLLRRTKTQVLEELPSRTEIVLHVDLSTEEMALYETLRLSAIAKLSNSDAEAGTKHLQVLAELMKLRRVCCNAKLVMADTPLPSAKLQLFGEVLSDLLDNRHKALVFSQFVDHLHILRDYLDEKKIQYQYLDGSTPAAQRKKRVDAFQAGQGDVFLISLKAGGTGLNLTAADYVIHMDPWWNPAVEDQASDRAHRIGQQRPVTIYRLVAKNTIEEKIVALHHQKRDLADSLLEGTDMGGKISTDELLHLLQN
jgi:superfamily II DNA or RNA helicase